MTTAQFDEEKLSYPVTQQCLNHPGAISLIILHFLCRERLHYNLQYQFNSRA